MSLAIVYARASVGIDAPLINVEVHLANGLPAFSIVGLPEASVREAKERVRSALINSHFEFPAKRITINLAPAALISNNKMDIHYNALESGLLATL
jgi:magnesium chelatase family protein